MFALFALASAAEIQVQASRPVMVAIDGAATGVAGTLVDTRNLDAGTHRVLVRNFVGSLLAEGTFSVDRDERLRLLFDRQKRVLVELDRVALGEVGPAPEPQPAGDPPPTPPVEVAKGPVRPAISLTDSLTGSLVITGLSDLSGSAGVGGELLPFVAPPGGFVALGLAPPAVELHLTDNGVLRYHGAVDVVAGGERTCELLFRQTAWALDCATTGPEREAPDAAR